MNFPKFMLLFHLSFLLLGLLSLFLMIAKVMSFDWSAFLIIVFAVLLNAFFEAYWVEEAGKRRIEKPEAAPMLRHVFPMISFIVPVHNDEQEITQCVSSLLKCAAEYRGPSEIIIVDDGSSDNTSEAAWATINTKRIEFMQIRSTIVRYTTSFGKDEAVKAGVNKAMGEYVAIIEPAISCAEPELINNLVDYLSATGKTATYRIHQARETLPIVPSTIRLYRADALRNQLNEKQLIEG